MTVAAPRQVPDIIPGPSWSDAFALDIALKLEGSADSMNDIMATHGVSSTDMLRLNTDKQFIQRVGHYRNEIRTNGLGFRMKAKVQAEELLSTSWSLIHAPDVSPAVKADLIKSTVRWAGLEPKGDAPTIGGSGGGVRISINIGQQANVITGSAHGNANQPAGLTTLDFDLSDDDGVEELLDYVTT